VHRYIIIGTRVHDERGQAMIRAIAVLFLGPPLAKFEAHRAGGANPIPNSAGAPP